MIGIVIAVVSALLAGSLAAALALDRDPSYRSQTVVEIRRNDLFLDVNPGTISVLNALRSKYAALIATEPIVGPTAESTGLPPGQVRAGLGAAITSDSLLFYPFATASSPERAERIAQQATEALVAYSEEEQREAGVPADDRIQLRIVQAAGPGNAIGPNTRRATVVGVAAAVIVGLGAYAAAELLWIRRRRSVATPPRLDA